MKKLSKKTKTKLNKYLDVAAETWYAAVMIASLAAFMYFAIKICIQIPTLIAIVAFAAITFAAIARTERKKIRAKK